MSTQHNITIRKCHFISKPITLRHFILSKKYEQRHQKVPHSIEIVPLSSPLRVAIPAKGAFSNCTGRIKCTIRPEDETEVSVTCKDCHVPCM